MIPEFALVQYGPKMDALTEPKLMSLWRIPDTVLDPYDTDQAGKPSAVTGRGASTGAWLAAAPPHDEERCA